MKEIYLNWKNYHHLVLKLSKKINFKSDFIVCINRGGLVIGRILSEAFKKPLAVITANSYKGRKKCNLKIGSISTICPVRGKVLLVDDKADTGQTLDRVKKKIEKIKGVKVVKTACLYKMPKSKFKPDWFIKEVDCWVVFPYEAR